VNRTSTVTTTLATALLVIAAVAGAGLVAADDLPSATDGDLTNGEELKSAQDDDDQVLPINYTFGPRNHQPGLTDGYGEHYAVGLTENITLHRIKIYSEAVDYANCEPGNTAAFGIDRGNDEAGTATDVSLLSSYKSYNSEADFIDIKYYKEEALAGGPIGFNTVDQVVAAQRNCYDNPSEPGWYRINGTITGSTNGNTNTDYKVRDLSQWIYICDCTSRSQAESKLGPPPGQSDDADTSTPSPTATATATATATPTPAPADGSDSTATPTPTPTPTASPTATAIPTATATATTTATATPDQSSGSGGSGTPTATPTRASGGGDSGDGAAATSSPAPGRDRGTGDAPRTPTVGAGPGFGVLAALAGVVLTGLLVRRRRE
jgi:PGF-CTERM protein